MKVYKFLKYEKIYPILFENEKKRIKNLLPPTALIEHIGSTAVYQLPGKGIIDIMISCPKSEITKIRNKLIKKEYVRGTSSNKDRIFMKREAKIKGKQRRFHIHITALNNPLWNKAVSFKNYLINHPKIAKQYAQLKKKAVAKCNNKGEVYRKLKDNFIQKHTKEAIKN